MTRKEYLVEIFERRHQFFLSIVFEQERKWGEIWDEANAKGNPGIGQAFGEFLWDLWESLALSVYHWTETELKRVLNSYADPPAKELMAMSLDQLAAEFAVKGIKILELESYKEVEIIRLVVNSIKHSRLPSSKLLKALGLSPAGKYEAILSSPAVCDALSSKIASVGEYDESPHYAVVCSIMDHCRIFLENVVGATNEQELRPVSETEERELDKPRYVDIRLKLLNKVLRH